MCDLRCIVWFNVTFGVIRLSPNAERVIGTVAKRSENMTECETITEDK